VITTYDEQGGYPHPDHIRCHEISVAAFDAAGDPDAYPDEGEPWQPLKLYYNLTWHKPRMLALHEAILATHAESPYAEWLAEWVDKPEDAERLLAQYQERYPGSGRCPADEQLDAYRKQPEDLSPWK
jgi:mycothiol S-conjugate amidase